MLFFYISNKNGICRIDQNKLCRSCPMLLFVLYNRRGISTRDGDPSTSKLQCENKHS